MSVSSRRRPRRQRRRGRGHSPPSRPPSRPGRGRFGACEAAPAAGPAGERARGRGAALCAPSRGAAGRGPGRLPLAAAELRAGGRGRGTGQRRAPLSAAPRPAPFCAGSQPEGGGTRFGPPAPTLPLRPGSRAGSPGAPLFRPRGHAGPGRFVCPGTWGTARRARGGRAAGVGRGPGPWAGRVGGMRARSVRPALAGLTDRPGCGARVSPRTFVGRTRGPREEAVDLVSPQSGLHVKNAAFWRLAVPGLAPKVGRKHFGLD